MFPEAKLKVLVARSPPLPETILHCDRPRRNINMHIVIIYFEFLNINIHIVIIYFEFLEARSKGVVARSPLLPETILHGGQP